MSTKNRNNKKAPVPNVPSKPKIPKKMSFARVRESNFLELREKAMPFQRLTVGAFLVLWLTGWTVGCVVLIWMVLTQNQPFMILFAIPFWASWVFVFGMVLNIFFGRQSFKLDTEGLNYEYRVLSVRVSKREVPLREILGFESTVAQGWQEGSSSHVVEADLGGKQIRLKCISEEEAAWIAFECEELLDDLWKLTRTEKPVRKSILGDPVEDEDYPDEDDELEEDDYEEYEIKEITVREKSRGLEPPSGCDWKMKADFDTLSFEKRGKIDLSSLGLMTFLCLFCNGIVSVFVLGLWGFLPDENIKEGWEWWGMFFFLIPFEVIGLGFFIAWLSVLFAPFHRVVWHFERGEARRHGSLFGLGFTRRYDLYELDKMLIEPSRKKKMIQTENDVPLWALTFIDTSGAEICNVNDVDYFEAEWMADTILRYR